MHDHMKPTGYRCSVCGWRGKKSVCPAARHPSHKMTFVRNAKAPLHPFAKLGKVGIFKNATRHPFEALGKTGILKVKENKY